MKYSIANDVASSMSKIMLSDEHRKLFGSQLKKEASLEKEEESIFSKFAKCHAENCDCGETCTCGESCSGKDCKDCAKCSDAYKKAFKELCDTLITTAGNLDKLGLIKSSIQLSHFVPNIMREAAGDENCISEEGLLRGSEIEELSALEDPEHPEYKETQESLRNLELSSESFKKEPISSEEIERFGPRSKITAPSGKRITDEEIDALLSELEGKSRKPTVKSYDRDFFTGDTLNAKDRTFRGDPDLHKLLKDDLSKEEIREILKKRPNLAKELRDLTRDIDPGVEPEEFEFQEIYASQDKAYKELMKLAQELDDEEDFDLNDETNNYHLEEKEKEKELVQELGRSKAYEIINWMKNHKDEYLTSTELVEAAALEFDHFEWTEGGEMSDHPIWDLAIEIMEDDNSSKFASFSKKDLKKKANSEFDFKYEDLEKMNKVMTALEDRIRENPNDTWAKETLRRAKKIMGSTDEEIDEEFPELSDIEPEDKMSSLFNQITEQHKYDTEFEDEDENIPELKYDEEILKEQGLKKKDLNKKSRINQTKSY